MVAMPGGSSLANSLEKINEKTYFSLVICHCLLPKNATIWIVCVELLVHIEDLLLLPLGVTLEPLLVFLAK